MTMVGRSKAFGKHYDDQTKQHKNKPVNEEKMSSQRNAIEEPPSGNSGFGVSMRWVKHCDGSAAIVSTSLVPNPAQRMIGCTRLLITYGGDIWGIGDETANDTFNVSYVSKTQLSSAQRRTRPYANLQESKYADTHSSGSLCLIEACIKNAVAPSKIISR
jgi:hypothetical protein